MIVPPISSVGSTDSSGGSELEGSSEMDGASEDGSEEMAGGSEFSSSLEVVPPLHAVRENTSVMDKRIDNHFFMLIILSFSIKGQIHCQSD